VVTWTDEQGAKERVESDAIKFGALMAPSAAPTLSGAVQVGGTLRVNLPAETGVSYSVQWQKQMLVDLNGDGDANDAGEGTYWMDIAGATGETLAIASEHAGDMIRALVTRTKGGDVTDIRALPTSPAAIPLLANTAPTKVKDYMIESSGMSGQDGTARVEVTKFPISASVTTTVTKVMDTVPLATLFEDLDGDKLTFTVTSGPGERLTGTGIDSSVWYTPTDGAGIRSLFLDANTGELLLITDELGGHDGAGSTDGTGADGGGNIVRAVIQAADGRGGTANANIDIRLNVLPVDIHFADAASGLSAAANGAGAMGTFAVTVQEQTGSGNAGTLIAHLNVQDQNMPGHKFGTHTVTVSDDRFMITHTGGGSKDTDSDGSTWELRLKKGAKLDFETKADQTIVLTFTVTDGGGLVMPTGKGAQPSSLTLTVTDDPTDDPAAPTPNNVPGLVDDETNGADPDTNDQREDDATDDDTDGGSQPPPPGMSLGGIIEDFVSSADNFDQDLLEGFMLVIDDGIDIA